MNSDIELSLVIAVYNGSQTILGLVEHIHHVFSESKFEIVLVNDGSADESEQVCKTLAETHPETVSFLHLSSNFGEHNAVLAGMNHATGSYLAVLDDDGQNPPEEIQRMLAHLKEHNFDVVYGRYRTKQHNWFRNLGSRFNDRMATIMLKKPKQIYFSSFKVINRFVRDEVIKYRGPFPYIDGIIYRTTSNIGQIDVEHRQREAGESGYTLKKLFRLWLNMFLGFSIAPLRISVVLGFFISILSVFLLVAIVIDKLYINPNLTVGIPTVLSCLIFFAGIQLVVLGTIGEYVGRIFLEQNGMPQFVVRYAKLRDETDE